MRKKSRKLYRHKLDAAVLGPVIAELPGMASHGLPVEVIGWRTWGGDLLRARAIYDDGLQLEMFLTHPKGGKQSLSSYKMTFRSVIAGKAKA